MKTVKILRCSRPTYWYCKHVGEIFAVEDYFDEHNKQFKYRVLKFKNITSMCIDKADVEEEFDYGVCLNRKLRPTHENDLEISTGST
jgi:hypothetical protein